LDPKNAILVGNLIPVAITSAVMWGLLILMGLLISRDRAFARKIRGRQVNKTKIKILKIMKSNIDGISKDGNIGDYRFFLRKLDKVR
jgi:hypothetical protein